MKERKDTLPENRKRTRKGNKLIIALLSICLIMTSLPNGYYQAFALAAESPIGGVQYEILSVGEIEEKTGVQTVAVGTPIEALGLPGSLTVSCRPQNAGSQGMQAEPQKPVPEGSALEGAGQDVSTSESSALEGSVLEGSVLEGAVLEGCAPDGSVLEGSAPDGSALDGSVMEGAGQESPVPEESQPEGATPEDTQGPETIQEVIIEGVTWESTPEYDMGQEGTYVFTPVLPQGYLLSEGVALPKVVVNVVDEENEVGRIPREKDDSDNDADAFYAEEKDGVLYAEEEEVLYADKEEPNTIRIAAGQDEVWDARTLSDVTVIVEENASLTITGSILISGEVAITGGGLVQRGVAEACFNVPPGCGLTLGNVTIDGKSISSSGSMLNVSGSLTLDDGCVVENCTSLRNGGAISLTNANAVLNKAAIINCAANHQGGAIYMVQSKVDIHGTKFEGCGVGSGASSDQGGALYIYYGCKVDINGAEFQGCSARGSGSRSAGGAFYAHTGNTIDIRDTVMENCTAGTQGGAFICYMRNVVNVYSGIFRNNRTTSTVDVHGNVGGGCMYNCTGTLNIYGGSFLNNYAKNKGGCINHCWEEGTTTVITGGIFEGNYCDYKDAKADYSGSGGIFNSSVGRQNAELKISGNVKFSGDGVEASGVDGVYLDQESGVPRKISISTTLTYPVELYVKAVEGYVIAEGKDGYTFLHERDMKKIKFIDIGNSGKTWYAKLSDDKTQVTITETDPGYKYFVYYISNGATGNVVDDKQYTEEDEAFVKSIKDEQGKDILTYEGRAFLGWSRNEDGSGKLYQAGESLGKMTDDVNLYAVFAEKLAADFYSGSAGNKVSKESVIDADGKGKVEAPNLEDLDDPEHAEDMGGWEKAGWAKKDGQFDIACQPGDEVIFGEPEEFCGIYKKNVTLAYDKNGWNVELKPANDVEPRYARVHEEITYQPAEFTVAAEPSYKDYRFVGWNTKPDGTGQNYHAGDTITRDANLTLYAVFDKKVKADFYSGAAGQKETRSAEAAKDGGASIEAPEIKELESLEGWEKAGWAREEEQFAIACQPKDTLTLEKDAVFCGIYQKGVTLTYDSNGGDSEPTPATDAGTCYARVHKEITYQPAEFTIAPGITHGDFAFAGWNTKPDGTGEYYHEDDLLSTEEDLTLYAIFTKSFVADFYSGGAGMKETKEAYASQSWTEPIEAPGLKDMEGWDKIGWTEDEERFQADFEAGKELTLTKHSSYYGIYRKDVILSYDLNGGEGEQGPVANSCYANVHDKVYYLPASFGVAGEPARKGYVFIGWNEKADGTGKDYQKGEVISIIKNQTLYARWAVARAGYRVEHYKQALDGSYLLDAVEEAEAVIGDEVRAEAKVYEGYSENTAHELRAGSGIVEADGSLALKFYYDRDIYEVGFDLNGAQGEAPGRQSVPYGGYVAEVEEPVRRGYHFKGWFMDDLGTEETRWDFDTPVEENYGNAAAGRSRLHEVTLYAKWADETAPVLEEGIFNQGYVNILDWIIRKRSLVVTVPIFEEGSGVKQLGYIISAEGEKDEAGELEIPEIRKGRSLPYSVLTPNQGKFASGNIQLYMQGGQTFAKVTLSEDFKGNIGLVSTDNAGNISSERTITAQEGGLIVEDNAPEIEFSSPDGELSRTFYKAVVVNVGVLDDVDGDGNDKITGGIASVAYQLDEGKEVSVPEEAFEGDIVEFYEFDVKVSGAGSHVLRVTAVDNAGNTNTRQAEVDIMKKTKPLKALAQKPTEIPPKPPEPPKPLGSEPKTGDSVSVKVYATLAMIAGLSYLLLYFAPDNGITEKEKEEMVSRLLRWAKGGGLARKILTFIALFFFLLYYHSIGKSVDMEWKWEDVWQ